MHCKEIMLKDLETGFGISRCGKNQSGGDSSSRRLRRASLRPAITAGQTKAFGLYLSHATPGRRGTEVFDHAMTNELSLWFAWD